MATWVGIHWWQHARRRGFELRSSSGTRLFSSSCLVPAWVPALYFLHGGMIQMVGRRRSAADERGAGPFMAQTNLRDSPLLPARTQRHPAPLPELSACTDDAGEGIKGRGPQTKQYRYRVCTVCTVNGSTPDFQKQRNAPLLERGRAREMVCQPCQ